jgi:hypothetical protein
VARGDARAGRLLQPVGREPQPGGLLAQLRAGPGRAAWPGSGRPPRGRRRRRPAATWPALARARSPSYGGIRATSAVPSAVSSARKAATSREGSTRAILPTRGEGAALRCRWLLERCPREDPDDRTRARLRRPS